MVYTSDPTRKKEPVPSSVVCPMLNSSMRMKVTLRVHKVWETIEPMLGEIIEEAKLVKKFLKGLTRNKYIHIGRLKAYEEQVKEETLKAGQGKLMFVSNNKQIHDEKDGSRGRGGSRVKGRSRGRGRANSQNQAEEIGVGVNVNEEARNQQVVTRYGGGIVKPRYLDNYVLLADLESEKMLFTKDGEPEHYHETANLSEWVDAMKEELESITMNKTWVLVKRPKRVKPIGLKWTYKIDRNVELNKLEAYSDGECVENGQVEVEHVPGNEKKVDILMKALSRIEFKEMRDLIGIQDLVKCDFKLKGEIVGLSLKKA